MKEVKDYFDFISLDEIRLRGHRVWLEDILFEHLGREMTPTELQRRFPTLTMEQIFASLLYYHANRQEVETYLQKCNAAINQSRRAGLAHPRYQALRARRSEMLARQSA